MMKNLFLLLVALLSLQVCKADLVDDAEAALNDLRQATSDNLNAGFLEHIKMSIEVDTIAFETKGKGDDVVTCVNKQSEEAVSLIYDKSSGLTLSVLKTVYDEEKQIVLCSRTDDACLKDVISDIKKKTAELPEVVSNEIKDDRKAVDEQIELIKACAA